MDPVCALVLEEQLKPITSRDPEPYLFAILVGLAQARRRYCREVLKEKTSRSGYKVSGILARGLAARVYWATVPAAILAKFNDERRVAPSPRIPVHYYDMPTGTDTVPPRWLVYCIVAGDDENQKLARIDEQGERGVFGVKRDQRGEDEVEDERYRHRMVLPLDKADEGDYNDAYVF